MRSTFPPLFSSSSRSTSTEKIKVSREELEDGRHVTTRASSTSLLAVGGDRLHRCEVQPFFVGNEDQQAFDHHLVAVLQLARRILRSLRRELRPYGVPAELLDGAKFCRTDQPVAVLAQRLGAGSVEVLLSCGGRLDHPRVARIGQHPDIISA